MLAYENSVPESYRTGFISKVTAICGRLGIDPNWLMVSMYFETGRTFSPSIRNLSSKAVGLIQFTTVGIQGLGVTLDQLAGMSALQQLDYVEKYLNRYKGRMTDLYQTYLAVFSPAYIGKSDAQRVYVSPSNSYALNKALDIDKDGAVTVSEIKNVIKRYIPAGVSDGVTITQVVSSNKVPIAVLAVIICGLVLIAGVQNE